MDIALIIKYLERLSSITSNIFADDLDILNGIAGGDTVKGRRNERITLIAVQCLIADIVFMCGGGAKIKGLAFCNVQ